MALRKQNELAQTVPRLTVVPPAGGATVVVLRDGEPLDPATAGAATPIDPGPHKVTATAPGKKPFSTEFRLGAGESKRDRSLETAELAAWTMVANTILNLDETLTKG